MSLRAVGTRLGLRTCTPTVSRMRTYSAFTKKEVDPQLDGYPQLPNESRQSLPPRGWWDPQMRRNYGDTMHEREELYSMWGPDIPHVAPATALNHFAIAFSGFVAFGFLCNYVLTPDRPAVPRQYPFNGLVRELGGIEENKANVETLEEDD
ncbi:Ndufb8, NADH dehydrogenase 19kDa subunit [Lactarius quietus]|nr:Ndufb8, NADH dehydrogenase 19kDa subunit [Lactarius quietus]